MATAAAAPISPLDRNHFLLRKIHSLTGIVPVGVFLIEHLLTNSRVFDWFGWFRGGPAVFNEEVHWIHNLPYLLLVEILFIFLPLAFHAGYGILIALQARPNAIQYPYLANRRYTLQRVTAWITLLFIIVHLLKFRFAHWSGWNAAWPKVGGEPTEFVGYGNPFELMWHGFHSWRPFGIEALPALVMGFYVIGLWAAVYHFCNGIWTFCISWGITIGGQSQRRVGFACVGLALVLLTWGHASLYAISKAESPTAGTGADAAAAPIGRSAEERSAAAPAPGGATAREAGMAQR